MKPQWPSFLRALSIRRSAGSADRPAGLEHDEAPERPRRTGAALRLVAITRILDEADIVEAFVRHTAHYVQHHLFMDNGSRDATLDILDKLRAEGFGITIFKNTSVSFNEIQFNTFLYREAVFAHDADWVICLDADEFIDDRASAIGLRGYLDELGRLRPDVDLLKISLTDYVFTRYDDPAGAIVPLRMTKHHPTGVNIRIVIHASLAHRGAVIDNGAHDVLVDGSYITSSLRETSIALAHYSERSAYQYIAKFVKGWAKVLAAGSGLAERGISFHYRGPFEILGNRPQDLIRNEQFMKYKGEAPNLIEDPIDYKGGPLRYTDTADELARAIQSMMGYVELLARQHGRLIDECSDARKLVDQWNAEHLCMK